MKKIFIPTDFSLCAGNALKVASKIARQTGASLHLFHTLDTPVHWAKLTVEEEKHFPETRANIAEAKRKLGEIATSEGLKDLKVAWTVYFNLNIIEALNTAACQESDLIVMGTHGTGTLTRMLLGSNTQKMVRLATYPVITVSEQTKEFDLKRIIVASSFDEGSAQEARTQNLAKALAIAFDAEICLLKVEGVIPSKEGYNAGSWEKLALEGIKMRKASISIDPFATVDEGIIQYAVEEKGDLIMVMTHGRKGLARFIMGSIAETIVNFSPVPVAVTHSTAPKVAKEYSVVAEGLAQVR